ncbi:ABC transporter ATP-binding protein [Trichothermofontia sp.]
MSDTVIRVENLGKRYLLKHQQQGRSRYVALRDVIADGVKSMGQRLLHPKQQKPSRTREEFWALKDVSFEVKRGEVVGIIGRNGAGKSTLLKLLSRITEPTTGRISIKGRVGSLLEVGTGFHPELTGRENIVLNGAILGMTRTEINSKFDEIVDFAEISQFLDTPVKHYSSGMYVKLAFAVAAHLEPEILVVDEVLAVGDAAFQKKCVGKMEESAQEGGKTILFVSHNMPIVKKLCKQSILIEQGKIDLIDSTDNVIQKYFEGFYKQTSSMICQYTTPLVSFEVFNYNNSPIISTGDDVKIDIQLDSEFPDLRFIIGVYKQGVIIADIDYSQSPLLLKRKSSKIEVLIRKISLVPGTYSLNLILISNDRILNHYPGVYTLEIEPGIYFDKPIVSDCRGYCCLNSSVNLN